MATIKSYTDIEQSKKLAEILSFDSADMYYFLVEPTPAGNIYHLRVQRVDIGIKNLPQYDEGDIPCWSLAALLSILDFPALTQEKEDEWEVCVCDYNNDGYIEEIASNPVDACYEMIIKLNELNLL